MKRILLYIICCLLSFALMAQTAPEIPEQYLGLGLPMICITTVDGEEPTSTGIMHPEGFNGASITDVVAKEARMKIFRDDTLWYDSGEYLKDEAGIKIKHRGNTSAYCYENKPFKLKLQKKADLIDFHEECDTVNRKSKDWVLLNCSFSIRTAFVYQVEKIIEMEYAPRVEYVNVFINNDYRGIYILSEIDSLLPTLNTTDGDIQWSELPEGTFSLNGVEQPIAGNALSVSSTLDDLSTFRFKWVRGDALGAFNETEVLSDTLSYTISENDYEHWLRVTVSSNTGNVICEKSVWVSKLPVLSIDTEDGNPITSKTDYVTAGFRIQGNAEYEQQYDGTAEIRGRGTTSWAQYPQKPYKLKLDKKTNLFGFGKSKHWVLLSNFNDKSCMRNYTASELAKRLGVLGMDMTWVDVVLNGEVKGCYMLSQHIRVDRNSVDIFDWEAEAEDVADNLFLAVKESDRLEEDDKKLLEETMTSNLAWVTDGCITFKGKTYNLADFGLKKEYDISQGYLLEATAKKDGLTQFTTPGNVHFEVCAPEFLYTNNGMLAYVTELWKEYEAEYSRVPTLESIKNFSKYADMESMVAVWLVNEIMGQGDPTNSRYSYIADDGKLHFGPVWDFDHAASCWSTDQNVNFFYTLIHNLPFIYFKKWFPDPELCQMTYETYWNVARPFIMDYISEGSKMDTNYALIAEAGRTNDMLWGSYPSILNPKAEPRTTAEDVEILRTFLQGHINWLDKQFQTPKTLIEAMNKVCAYPCSPDLIDGIASPKPSPQGKGFNKIIKNKHLYIIKDGTAYSVVGKRVR